MPVETIRAAKGAERAVAVLEPPEGEGLDAPISFVPMPNQIPSSILTQERRAELVTYLDEQITRAEGERGGFIRKLARWKVAYRAPLPSEPKHFPIFNASNIPIPVIKEAVNVIAAQVVQATMTARPTWVFRDLSPDWEPFTDDMEVFMDLASDRDLELPKHAIPWIIETCKLGTGIIEEGYDFDERGVYKYSSDGKKAWKKMQVWKDGPCLSHVPLDKWWIRWAETDIQAAPWVAVEMVMQESELRRWAKRKKIPNIEEIVAVSGSRDRNLVESVQDEIEETQPIRHRDFYRIFKVWVSFDVDGDGEEEEILCYFDWKTRTLLGEFFPVFDHGKRPFVKTVYFPQEDRFYGEGLCEMLEGIQESITQTANRRADNAAMANLKMIIKKKMVKDIQPGDPLYSGKVIEANDPFRDIREFALADIYPSTVTEEQIMQQRGDRVAGVNEGVSGSAMPVTRTTASAQLALLQEQAKRIDLTVRNVREGFNQIGRFTLALYFQFGTAGKPIAWMGEKGKIVEAIFRIPRGLIDLGLGIKAQTPTSLQNRQVKRENKIALFNLLMQLHKELLPFAQAFAPQMMPVIANSLVKSSKKYMTDVLETFEETDTEGVLAGLTVLEKILPRAEDLGGLEDFERGVVSAETLEAVSRLESSLQEAKAVGEGSRRISDRSGDIERISAPEGVPGGSIPGIGVFEPPTGDGEGRG